MESVKKLILAAERGEAEDLQLLLNYPNDLEPDACTSTGRTALHTAALHNHTSCAEVLLNKGANIEFADQNCTTALHIAALNGNCAMITLLIRRGANINAVTRVRWPNAQTAALPSPHARCSQLAQLLPPPVYTTNHCHANVLEFRRPRRHLLWRAREVPPRPLASWRVPAAASPSAQR
jgi:ankyrin repeat protein